MKWNEFLSRRSVCSLGYLHSQRLSSFSFFDFLFFFSMFFLVVAAASRSSSCNSWEFAKFMLIIHNVRREWTAQLPTHTHIHPHTHIYTQPPTHPPTLTAHALPSASVFSIAYYDPDVRPSLALSADKAGPRLSTCSDRKPRKMNVLKVGQIMKYYKTRVPCLHFKNGPSRQKAGDKCLKICFSFCLGSFRK